MPQRIFECLSLSVLYLLFVCALSLSAATEAGRISGKILDPRGTPVAGARVKLQNSAGRLVGESSSDAQGNFTLESIDTGEYQLTAESDAFVSVVVGVSLARGQQKQINLRFRQLVSIAQAITVVASAPSSLPPGPRSEHHCSRSGAGCESGPPGSTNLHSGASH